MEIGKENNGIQVKPLPILISERNIEKYGFGCFYYPDETNLQGNYWHRMIKGISPKGSAGSETELRIPGRFLVPLSRGSSQKLIQDSPH